MDKVIFLPVIYEGSRDLKDRTKTKPNYMKKIKLSQNQVAIVDDEDYEYLSKWKWCASKGRKTFYAIRKDLKINKTVCMHRLIANCYNNKLHIDHIDGNGLNNTKENLRICTIFQNNMNKTSWGKSKYKGVSLRKNKCQAQIQHNGKKMHLGYFKSEYDAAKKYDEAAKKLFGCFAKLNF